MWPSVEIQDGRAPFWASSNTPIGPSDWCKIKNNELKQILVASLLTLLQTETVTEIPV